MRRTAPASLALLVLALASATAALGASWELRRVPVEGPTPPLRVWSLEGPEEGPTLLVIGGIHGDEPGGYLAADRLVDRLGLTRGRILVVPRANLPSILTGERELDGDLNREFGREEPHPVVAALQGLMAEADGLLNLHDGWGFYAESWVSERRNPRRYGQSIVADAETWTTGDGETLELGAMARRVIERVNRHIQDESHHFHFLDTRTADPSSRYSHLVHSATYYGLRRHDLPGFGVETSKDLPSDALKIRYQILVIKAFLEEFGLLEDPAPVQEPTAARLDYLLLRLGEDGVRALRPGETIEAPRGTPVEVVGAEANVERGLVVDVEEQGGLDDTGSIFSLDGPMRLRVQRDHQVLGRVEVRPEEPARRALRPGPTRRSSWRFLAEVNGEVFHLREGEALEVRAGDRVRLLDPEGPFDPRRLTLDLIGYPGGTARAPHEDRGHTIDTATQLLEEYALLGGGEYYRVQAREEGVERAGFYLRVLPPRLVALTVDRDGGGSMRLADNETVRVRRGEVLTIREVETTVADNEGILVNFKGYEGGPDGEDRGRAIDTGRDLLSDWSLDPQGRLYEILVLHHEEPIGRVLVELEEIDQERAGR